MQDDETRGAQQSEPPALQFLAVSLRDGLDFERLHLPHDRKPVSIAVLRDRFIWAMQRGLNNAIGYLHPRDETSLPVLIPKRAWDHPSINWDTAGISGAGFHFVDLRVLISTLNYEMHDLFCGFDPVTELAPFRPSDQEREQLGIATFAVPIAPQPEPEPEPEKLSPSVPSTQTGRPTLKDEIIAAFHAIEKDMNWTNKKLAVAVREQVKKDIDKQDDKGLGDDAILKHLLLLWRDYKNRPG